MFILSICATILTVMVGSVWASRHLLISRQKRRGGALTAEHPGPPNSAPFISVVVAAKDEADNIGSCLRSVLAQDYPAFEVIVSNDRSEDDTRAIVERIAAEDPRVQLINIEHLPPGW